LIKLTNLLGENPEDNRWKSFECHFRPKIKPEPFDAQVGRRNPLSIVGRMLPSVFDGFGQNYEK